MMKIPVDKGRRLFAVIGKDVSRSKSPAVHNAAFAALGLNCRFLPLSTNDPLETVSETAAVGYGGLAVTMPYKSAVISLVTQIDEADRLVGAINTIKFKNDEIIGANTDIIGIIASFREKKILLEDHAVVIIGAGGAARAALAACVKEGAAQVTILARDERKARELAEGEITENSSIARAGRLGGDQAKHAIAEADIIIQTTPLGSVAYPEKTPIEPGWLPPQAVLLDIVYSPTPTVLMSGAVERGLQVIGGDRMFLHQAAAQFEMWTGLAAPLDAMEKAFHEEIEE